MNEKKMLSLDDVLNKEFRPSLRGYNPLEVDTFLDEVGSTIFALNSQLTSAGSEVYKLSQIITGHLERIKKLEIENASLRNRLETSGTTASIDNIDYLKRIRDLELALHKVGVDPSSIN